MSNKPALNFDKSTVEKTDGSQQRFSCYSIMHYFASDFGLFVITVAYAVGGAYLFIYLEQYIELQNCQLASLEESIEVTDLSEEIYDYVISSTDNITEIYQGVVDYLDNFTSDIYDRKSTYNYVGQDCPTASGWIYSSALLFTINVITTIGFGQVTPVSWEGRITCICYAVIGIPIFLICLTRISAAMCTIFHFMYSGLLRCVCCYCRIRSRRNKNHSKSSENSSNKYGVDHVGTTSMDPSWPEAYEQSNNHLDDDNDYFDEEFEDSWNRIRSRVPAVVGFSIIVGYLYLGAFMFHNTEGWTMTTSIYFCYIALSTIGFGDYVPGMTPGPTESYRFMAASVYIVIGLAILGMSFDLIKDSIVDQFAWCSKKFGAVTLENDQVDDDHAQYARFQYATDEKNDDWPPACNDTSTGEQWLSDIKDKVESNNEFSNSTKKYNKYDKHATDY
ncbi:unnamed protein product [Rotaria socialis]|uniref:Potassium channel domain-containing protein n=1 Tax=Rotaria socialis TaxID=392032 RepID=A0A819W5B7_9BILA|nr:unnamed protein product [Rotaria socialis]CAF3481865.1 unnamed protein product [Rotaria socialis]CAF4120434.1 unnamed protein product [Rotaria socialis]CAF4789862.1 unnamed protein product [Rotaria socialis]